MRLLDYLYAKYYKLEDRMRFQGLLISIENRKGSTRSGVNPYTKKKWSVTMTYPYGYIRLSRGVDGDHVDCFVGPNENAKNAYVIHQVDPTTGAYDEDKCMLGFDSPVEAKKAYLANYDTDEYFGSMETIPMDAFKKKVLATKDRPRKIAAQFKMEAAMELNKDATGNPLSTGDQVTVDPLPGRAVVVDIAGPWVTVKFRNGMALTKGFWNVRKV